MACKRPISSLFSVGKQAEIFDLVVGRLEVSTLIPVVLSQCGFWDRNQQSAFREKSICLWSRRSVHLLRLKLAKKATMKGL